MASQQSTVDYLLDQMSAAGKMSVKKMFGEYGVYCDGKIVALVCDDQLFIKPTSAAKQFIGDYTEAPPYPGAKPYLVISGDQWEDADWLSELIKISVRALSKS
jgi:TfoX/Sxy family transcriptional regulator of competence genes